MKSATDNFLKSVALDFGKKCRSSKFAYERCSKRLVVAHDVQLGPRQKFKTKKEHPATAINLAAGALNAYTLPHSLAINT